MLSLILLFLDFTLFILSFIFIILDMKHYENDRYSNLKGNELPKRSSQSLLFSLLALMLAVIVSLTYY
jgi:ABC-type Fe3+ transport system permease subunit